MAGLAARRARLVIVDSEATRRDVLELLGVPAEKLRVVSLGVSRGIHRVEVADVERFRAERRLPGDYVLYVGARKRHKNLELLLRAWAAMSAAERPALVLSGSAWAQDEPPALLAHELGIADVVRFAGTRSANGICLLLQRRGWWCSRRSQASTAAARAMACGVPRCRGRVRCGGAGGRRRVAPAARARRMGGGRDEAASRRRPARRTDRARRRARRGVHLGAHCACDARDLRGSARRWPTMRRPRAWLMPMPRHDRLECRRLDRYRVARMSVDRVAGRQDMATTFNSFVLVSDTSDPAITARISPQGSRTMSTGT